MTITPVDIKSEKHFDELHRTYGGSSFAPALFDAGYADMPSMYSVYAHLSGQVEDVGPADSQRLRIGKMIENVIAAELNLATGWSIIDAREYWHGKPGATRMFVLDKERRIGATCDRYVKEHEDGPGIIECKNRDYLQWVENYTDEDASIRDQIQLAHQFVLHPEITWGCVAVLVGGNSLKHYVYRPTDGKMPEIMADVEAKWAELWQRIADRDEPTLMGAELPIWLEAHRDALERPPEDLIEIGADHVKGTELTFDMIAKDYLDAKERAKHYGKIERDMKALIVQRLDEHTTARSNRYRIVAKYTPVKASSVTLPLTVQDGLRGLLPKLSRSEQNFLGTVIGFEKETRKAGFRLTLNFDDDPVDAEAQAAQAEQRKRDMKAAQDFQAPLDDGKEPA